MATTARKTGKKKQLSAFQVRQIKKATSGLKKISTMQAKLDLEIKKHKKHVTAMFDHDFD